MKRKNQYDYQNLCHPKKILSLMEEPSQFQQFELDQANINDTASPKARAQSTPRQMPDNIAYNSGIQGKSLNWLQKDCRFSKKMCIHKDLNIQNEDLEKVRLQMANEIHKQSLSTDQERNAIIHPVAPFSSQNSTRPSSAEHHIKHKHNKRHNKHHAIVEFSQEDQQQSYGYVNLDPRLSRIANDSAPTYAESDIHKVSDKNEQKISSVYSALPLSDDKNQDTHDTSEIRKYKHQKHRKRGQSELPMHNLNYQQIGM